jgi:hypothetical protein
VTEAEADPIPSNEELETMLARAGAVRRTEVEHALITAMVRSVTYLVEIFAVFGVEPKTDETEDAPVGSSTCK